jgi:hypothetical protein
MDQDWSVYKDPEPGYPVSTTRSGDKPCAHAISHIPNAGRRQSYPSSQWLCLLMNGREHVSAIANGLLTLKIATSHASPRCHLRLHCVFPVNFGYSWVVKLRR